MIYNLHQFIVSPSSNRKRRDWKPIFLGVKRCLHLAGHHVMSSGSHHPKLYGIGVFLGFLPGSYLLQQMFRKVGNFCRSMGVKTGVFYPPTSRSSLAPLNLAPTSRSQCVSRSFQPLFNRGKTQCLSGTFNFPKGT